MLLWRAKGLQSLEGIKIFVRVVESGSFSAVARELGTGQPAISKQVAALEEHLGAQLLMRASRSLSLTGAGRPEVGAVVPMTKARAAIAQMIDGRTQGKTVFTQ
jgi:DNA-binding transcriptional LysR family regulator